MIEGKILGNQRVVLVNGRELDIKKSIAIVNHSPTGFSWGYGGSGPAQLALAILLEFYTEAESLMLYQDFKEEFLVKIPSGASFSLPTAAITAWANEKLFVYKLLNDHDFLLIITERMKKYGGSFVKALADCVFCADKFNLTILVREFTKYFIEYKNENLMPDKR